MSIPAGINNKKISNGFTLIEILLVVTVIGILSGVLVTVIKPTSQKEKTEEAVKTANLNKIVMGIQAYYAAESKLPVDANNDGIPDPPAYGTYIKTWPSSDYKYGTDGNDFGVTVVISSTTNIKYRSDWNTTKKCGGVPAPSDSSCQTINSTTCGTGGCQTSLGETCETCPLDCGACIKCGNKKCENPPENCTNCPVDCSICPSTCGDGKCGASENCNNCSVDCKPCCPNGNCDTLYGETCATCSADCGVCDPVCGDGQCNGKENCYNCPFDCGVCEEECGNHFCITSAGENCNTCPADCGVCVVPVCGNLSCESGETCTNCPADCSCAVCGNKVCDAAAGENCMNCPGDCPLCPADICGDGTCGVTETYSTCPFDCPRSEE